MRKAGVLLGIGLAALAVLVLAGWASAQTDPPSSGSWYVYDQTLVKDRTIYLNNSMLYVGNGGNLTLSNCILYFNNTYYWGWEADYGVHVESGGIFNLERSTVTVHNEPLNSRHYYFRVHGTLNLNASRVAEVASVDWLDMWPNGYYGGIAMYQASGTLANSVIENCRGNGLYLESSSPDVTNCTFRNNGYDGNGWSGWGAGILARDSRANISRCRIAGNNAFYNWSDSYYSTYGFWYNSSTLQGFGMITYQCKLNITDTNITGHGRQAGQICSVALETFGGSTRLVLHSNQGWGLGVREERSSSTLVNCSITFNYRIGLELQYSTTQVRDCLLRDQASVSTGWNYNKPNPTTLNLTLYNYIEGQGAYSYDSTGTFAGCNFSWNGKWSPGQEGASDQYLTGTTWKYQVHWFNDSYTCSSYPDNIPCGLKLERGYEGGSHEVSRCNFTDNGGAGIISIGHPNGKVSGCRFEHNGMVYRFRNFAFGMGMLITSRMTRDGAGDGRALRWEVTDCTFKDNDRAPPNSESDGAGIGVIYHSVLVKDCNLTGEGTGLGVMLGTAELQGVNSSADRLGLYAMSASVSARECRLQGFLAGAFLDRYSELLAERCVVSCNGSGSLPQPLLNALSLMESSAAAMTDCTIVGPHHLFLERRARADLLNTSADISKCLLLEGARLSIAWRLSIHGVWQNDRDLDRADFSGNASGLPEPNISGALRDGWLRDIVVPEAVYTGQPGGQPPRAEKYNPWTLDLTRGSVRSTWSFSVMNGTSLKLTLQDPAPPSINIHFPSDGVHVARNDLLFQGNCSDEDSGLEFIELGFDNSTWQAVTGIVEWSWRGTLPDGKYTLHVRARDRAGLLGHALAAFVVDTRPPQPSFLDPPNGALVNTPVLNITVGADDAVRAWVDGTPVNVTQGRILLTRALSEGPNHFTFRLEDKAGNQASAVLEVVLDTVPPPLKVFSPENGEVLTTRSVKLLGASEKGAVVKVGGVGIDAPEGFFTHDLELVEGKNTLLVQAFDRAGNAASLSIMMTVDTIPPVLEVLSPADGSRTNSLECLVSGRTEAGAVILVNGLQAVNENGSFQITLLLGDGANGMELIARDRYRNAISLRLTVIVDRTAPSVASARVDRAVLEIVLSEEVGFKAGHGLSVNGATNVAWSTSTRCTWPIPQEWTDGTRDLTIMTWDDLNNTSNFSFRITIDRTPPALTSLKPFGASSEYTTRNATLTITGRTEPGSRVDINGIQLLADAGGVFSATLVLPFGKTSVKLTVSDASGNDLTRTVTVTRTEAKPAGAGSDLTVPLLLLAGVVLAAVLFAVGLLLGKRAARPTPSAEGARGAGPPEAPPPSGALGPPPAPAPKQAPRTKKEEEFKP